jgi:diguanylate cyclase (GGDEF)-like protein
MESGRARPNRGGEGTSFGWSYVSSYVSSCVSRVRSILAIDGVGNIIVVSLLSLAAIWFGLYQLIKADEYRTEQAAYQDTANLARAFEEHIIRLIQAYDQILVFVRTAAAKEGHSFSLATWAAEQRFVNEAALQIAISNKDGLLIDSNLPLITPTSIRDREHFRVHKNRHVDQLFISQPVLGRVSGKWSIHLSRRIDGPDGAFAGIITIAIDPDYLSSFYKSVDLGNGMILLAGLDGVVRARAARGAQVIGQNIKSGTLFEKLARNDAGSYVTDGRLDGNRRLTSYRVVRDYPLVVAVGRAETDVFADFARGRALYVAAAALVSLLLIVFTIMLVKRQIAAHRTQSKLWDAANVDALTGLANRYRLNNLIAASVEQPDEEHRFALLLFDLDNFKLLNDTLGHEAGDLVLRAAAKRIKRVCRGAYCVARLGGDEFAVLVQNPSRWGDVEELAERILRALCHRISYRGQRVEVSSSIGIARFPDHASSWTGIFRAADLALYRAKQAGRNRFVVYDPGMLAEAERRREVLEAVRAAIRSDRIVPYYQPKISVKTGEVVGFEAVARIAHSDGSLSTPQDFVHALDDPEISRAFGLKVVERVTGHMRTWREAGLEMNVAVNLSAAELRASDYAESVLAIVKRNAIPVERFEIEITETAALDDGTEPIRLNLGTFAEHGITIALDDFGTGFASLTHLKTLPVTQIKIDRSFVANILTDAGSWAIVDAVVRLSHSLGKIVVAEGVEEEEQLAAIASIGCDIAQGFLFSKPVHFDEVGLFLLRHSTRKAQSSADEARSADVGGADIVNFAASRTKTR